MSLPSFARATTSSNLKVSSKDTKSKDVKIHEKSPEVIEEKSETTRRLKRPSMLTRRARESIAYNADLHYIKPANTSKPCPLAAIPSEIRSIIYSYVFGDFQTPVLMSFRRIRHWPSALLQICRAIRIEAAYMYYTSAAFVWIVKNLNFTMVMDWLSTIQPSHRALLSRNQNLAVEIRPWLQKSYTYPPKDFLLDDSMQNHWKACQPFGNLYNVKHLRTQPGTLDHTRVNFILFCRLASWLKLCSQPAYAEVKWNYNFDMPQDNYGKRELNRSLGQHERNLCLFLRFQLRRLWIRNQCVEKVKQPILDLADAFIEAYARMEGPEPIPYPCTGMVERLKAQREILKNW
jgi:hypothetical protein